MGSNLFVNPNQRGVDLPPGCKDLMDVLKIDGGERPGAESQMVWYGVLSNIEQQVESFLQSGTDTQLFSVGIPKRHIMLILAKRGGVLTLNFSVPAKKQSIKDAIRRIFQDPKFGESFPGREYVSVALNPAMDAVARMMMELPVEGFGVLEGERLMFCSYARVEKRDEGGQ